ncbi:unnamed protein product [Phytomonas sp. Hart1]|nr:unnamed protein product [Phytomonas sp. Hart1]|eukprot:CCW70914.1 unnamed protein product [Phytomonas sp. isolate Hart1]
MPHSTRFLIPNAWDPTEVDKPPQSPGRRSLLGSPQAPDPNAATEPWGPNSDLSFSLTSSNATPLHASTGKSKRKGKREARDGPEKDRAEQNRKDYTHKEQTGMRTPSGIGRTSTPLGRSRWREAGGRESHRQSSHPQRAGASGNPSWPSGRFSLILCSPKSPRTPLGVRAGSSPMALANERRSGRTAAVRESRKLFSTDHSGEEWEIRRRRRAGLKTASAGPSPAPARMGSPPSGAVDQTAGWFEKICPYPARNPTSVVKKNLERSTVAFAKYHSVCQQLAEASDQIRFLQDALRKAHEEAERRLINLKEAFAEKELTLREEIRLLRRDIPAESAFLCRKFL